MAAIFLDLDGTILQWRTNEPINGAVTLIHRLAEEEHQIIFTTRRGREPDPFKDHEILSKEATEKVLKNLFPDIDYQIYYGVDSPRIVVNDEGCAAGNREKDEEWTLSQIEEVFKKFDELREKLHENLEE